VWLSREVDRSAHEVEGIARGDNLWVNSSDAKGVSCRTPLALWLSESDAAKSFAFVSAKGGSPGFREEGGRSVV
jgi:hypothetical protein